MVSKYCSCCGTWIKHATRLKQGLCPSCYNSLYPSDERNIWITVTDQAPGNLTLSGLDWKVRYSFVTSVKVLTASTDWDMWLCETSAFNTSLVSSRKIAEGRDGDTDITVFREYNSDSTNVYLKYIDNVGASPASIYIVGKARRH